MTAVERVAGKGLVTVEETVEPKVEKKVEKKAVV